MKITITRHSKTLWNKEKRLQGIICLGGNFIDLDEVSFKNIGVPVVLTSVNTVSSAGRDKYSTVGIDNLQSAYSATEYLIKKRS